MRHKLQAACAVADNSGRNELSFEERDGSSSACLMILLNANVAEATETLSLDARRSMGFEEVAAIFKEAALQNIKFRRRNPCYNSLRPPVLKSL